MLREASAGACADLQSGIVHTVQVGIADRRLRLGVLHTALHAAQHREGPVGIATNGDHRLHFTTRVACAERVVVRVAGTQASARIGVPHTHVVVATSSGSGQHATARHAHASVRVPHALIVAVAANLFCPAELADLGQLDFGGRHVHIVCAVQSFAVSINVQVLRHSGTLESHMQRDTASQGDWSVYRTVQVLSQNVPFQLQN